MPAPAGRLRIPLEPMTLSRLCTAALLCLLATAGRASAQGLLDSLSSDVRIDGMTTTVDPETGIATVSGDVRIEYQDVQMRCASASYNQLTGNIHATGGVVIWKAGTIYRGDTIDYNSITGELTGNNVRSSMPADQGNFFYHAERFDTETKLLSQINAENVTFTMHDVANPNFRVTGSTMGLRPGDKVEMHDIKYYAGRTPVLWLPYLGQSIDQEAGFRIGPGYQSRWGAFLLSQYTVFHGEHTEARYKFDLRSRRGVAAGVDFFSIRHSGNRQNFGTLTFYGVNDMDTAIQQAGGQRVQVDNLRYRLNFQHRVYLPGPDVSTWYIDFDINKLSDPHFYEDFFFQEFRTTPEPDNHISIIKTDDAFVATLMAKFQLNQFYRTSTRLPEASVDFTRRPIFGTVIQHQGTISAGVYGERLGKYEEVELQRLRQIGGLGAAAVNALGAASSFHALLGQPLDPVINPVDVAAGMQVIDARLAEPQFTRFHTYHEFLYPKTFFGWLNLTPRVGFGMTSYHSIDGSLANLRNFTRGIFSAGLDISFKLTRSWDNVQSSVFGLDGIRHVIQPYINYSYLDASMDAGLPGIDRLTATTRPRSIDVPLFTAIDSLRSWNVARVGVYNLLQTRRDYAYTDGFGGFVGQLDDKGANTYTWAGMNTFVDLYGKDPEFGRDMSNLFNEIFWRPVPWITFLSTIQLPLEAGIGSYQDINNSIIFMPTRNLSIEVGSQYLTGHPFFPGDSHRFTSRIYARLSENWGFSTNHIYEADDGTMEFQSYSITRDVSSWIISLGAMIRDNRNGVSDYGLLLGFTLKEFPQLNFDLDIDPNPGAPGNP